MFYKGGPEFVIKPKQRQAVIEGDDLRLQCKAFGVPTPIIQWKVDGKYLERSNIDENGTLIVRGVKHNAFEGFDRTYECEASNVVDKITEAAKITIYCK